VEEFKEEGDGDDSWIESGGEKEEEGVE